jgi:hypothetical protein
MLGLLVLFAGIEKVTFQNSNSLQIVRKCLMSSKYSKRNLLDDIT